MWSCDRPVVYISVRRVKASTSTDCQVTKGPPHFLSKSEGISKQESLLLDICDRIIQHSFYFEIVPLDMLAAATALRLCLCICIHFTDSTAQVGHWVDFFFFFVGFNGGCIQCINRMWVPYKPNSLPFQVKMCVCTSEMCCRYMWDLVIHIS